MLKEGLIKPLIVRPKEGQSVIVLSAEKRGQRLRITKSKISIEPTAMDKLGRFVQSKADDLNQILGTDFDAKSTFAIDLNVSKIIDGLKMEGRTDQEVINLIYTVLSESAKQTGEPETITRSKVRKLYKILKKLSQGKSVRI